VTVVALDTHRHETNRQTGRRMTDLAVTAARARIVREDCARDAETVDRTPFTAAGVGPLFGGLLAQIAALAKCIEELAEAHG
jgi:hypothetical protein